jgi:hypothetical protein
MSWGVHLYRWGLNVFIWNVCNWLFGRCYYRVSDRSSNNSNNDSKKQVMCEPRYFWRPVDPKENPFGEEKIIVNCSLWGGEHEKCKYEIKCEWMYLHTRVVMVSRKV